MFHPTYIAQNEPQYWSGDITHKKWFSHWEEHSLLQFFSYNISILWQSSLWLPRADLAVSLGNSLMNLIDQLVAMLLNNASSKYLYIYQTSGRMMISHALVTMLGAGLCGHSPSKSFCPVFSRQRMQLWLYLHCYLNFRLVPRPDLPVSIFIFIWNSLNRHPWSLKESFEPCHFSQ